MSSLATALHCADSMDQFSNLLLRLVTREAAVAEGGTANEFPVHLHGSLVLQEMLWFQVGIRQSIILIFIFTKCNDFYLFQKPIRLVTSLLSLDPPRLRAVLADPRGCHVTDALVTSDTVGEKSREAVVKRLQGEFAALACSKHGSR